MSLMSEVGQKAFDLGVPIAACIAISIMTITAR
jgi:hypothetical protein